MVDMGNDGDISDLFFCKHGEKDTLISHSKQAQNPLNQKFKILCYAVTMSKVDNLRRYEELSSRYDMMGSYAIMATALVVFGFTLGVWMPKSPGYGKPLLSGVGIIAVGIPLVAAVILGVMSRSYGQKAVHRSFFGDALKDKA